MQIVSKYAKAGWVGVGLAAALGIFHTFLLYGETRGINAIIFTNLLAVAVLGVAHWWGRLTPRVAGLSILLVGLGVAIGGRHSGFLIFWNRIGYILAWLLLLGQLLRPHIVPDLSRFGWRGLRRQIRIEITLSQETGRDFAEYFRTRRWRKLPWPALLRGGS